MSAIARNIDRQYPAIGALHIEPRFDKNTGKTNRTFGTLKVRSIFSMNRYILSTGCY